MTCPVFHPVRTAECSVRNQACTALHQQTASRLVDQGNPVPSFSPPSSFLDLSVANCSLGTALDGRVLSFTWSEHSTRTYHMGKCSAWLKKPAFQIAFNKFGDQSECSCILLTQASCRMPHHSCLETSVTSLFQIVTFFLYL